MNKETIEQEIKNSLKMIHYYYSTNKSIKDMTITFYHAAKNITFYHNQFPQQQLNNDLFKKFNQYYNKYFASRDVSQLDQGTLQIIKTIRRQKRKWIKLDNVSTDAMSIVTFNQLKFQNEASTSEHRLKINYFSLQQSKHKRTPDSNLPQIFQSRSQNNIRMPITQNKQIVASQKPLLNNNNVHNQQNNNSYPLNLQQNVNHQMVNSNIYGSDVNQTFINNLKSSNHSIASQHNYADLKRISSPQVDFNNLIAAIMKQYSQHRLDSAAALTQKALSVFDSIQPSKLCGLNIKRQQLSQILIEHKQMMDCYSNFNLPGWKLDKQQKGIKIFLNNNKSNEVGVLIQAEFDVNSSNFFVIASQVDFFDKFIPFCYDCKQIKRLARNAIFGTSKIKLPIISDRQLFFYAIAVNRLDVNGSIFIYSKTIHNDKRSQQKYQLNIPPQNKCVRLEYIFFMVQCKIINRNKLKIRLASSIDMKLNFLPNFVISMAARKFSVDAFMSMLKYEKKFQQTEWAVRKKQRKQIYDFFDKIREDYLNKIQK